MSDARVQSADTESGGGVLSRDRWAGRRNPSIHPPPPPSPVSHLSIDIPGSPSSASGFGNYHQSAASSLPEALTDGSD